MVVVKQIVSFHELVVFKVSKGFVERYSAEVDGLEDCGSECLTSCGPDPVMLSMPAGGRVECLGMVSGEPVGIAGVLVGFCGLMLLLQLKSRCPYRYTVCFGLLEFG